MQDYGKLVDIISDELLKCFEVPLLGGYEEDGAYWGCSSEGRPSGTPRLYRVKGTSFARTLRAWNRELAIAAIDQELCLGRDRYEGIEISKQEMIRRLSWEVLSPEIFNLNLEDLEGYVSSELYEKVFGRGGYCRTFAAELTEAEIIFQVFSECFGAVEEHLVEMDKLTSSLVAFIDAVWSPGNLTVFKLWCDPETTRDTWRAIAPCFGSGIDFWDNWNPSNFNPSFNFSKVNLPYEEIPYDRVKEIVEVFLDYYSNNLE